MGMKCHCLTDFLIPGKYYWHNTTLTVLQFCVGCLLCPAFFLFSFFQVTEQIGWRIAYIILAIAGSVACAVQIYRNQQYMNMRYALSDTLLCNFCGKQCKQCQLRNGIFVSSIAIKTSGKLSFIVRFALISQKPISSELGDYSENLDRCMQYAWKAGIFLVPMEKVEEQKLFRCVVPTFPTVAYLPE